MWNVDLRLGYFSPGLLVPIQAYPALIGGFLLLFISVYTLTFTAPSQRAQYATIRLMLTPPAILLFWNFGYDTSYNPPGAQVAVGMAVIGLYGIIRVIETSVVTLVDPAPSLWVNTANGMPMPLPVKRMERLSYTLDLTTSLRGTSWFKGRHWNWAPTPLIRSPAAYMTRRAFLLNALSAFFGQYLLVDVLDTINKSRTWDTLNHFPITTLSIPEQIVFSVSVCVGTVLSICVMYTLMSGVAVALGSPPAAWPPMFDRPFHSISLADFWARRWHAIFRRSFTRLSLLILALLPIPVSYVRTRTAARALAIFALSAGLHVMLMYRVERAVPRHPSLMQTFLDPSVLSFFLVQPIGLALETLVVIPVTKRLFAGEGLQRTVTRVWAWTFMLWAGRFWSDVWVKRGLWGEEEHVVGYSLVRGLLTGHWKA